MQKSIWIRYAPSRLLIIGVLLLELNAMAQEPKPLSYEWTAVQLDQSVQIAITLDQGNTCNGIVVQRSSDSINYATIASVAGQCGSGTRSIRYEITDTAPVANHISYYQLRLGSFVSEPISLLFIKINGSGYNLFPQPVRGIAMLYFENFDRRSFQLQVIDMNGHKIMTKSGIKEDRVSLDMQSQPTGAYIFRLQDDKGKVIEGKLIKE